MKKMKKIIILYIILAIGITSCNDEFFDVGPGDKLTDVSFWKTEKEASDALTAAYATFSERGSVSSTWNTYLFAAGTMSDDATGTYNSFQDGSVGSKRGSWSAKGRILSLDSPTLERREVSEVV